MDTNDIGLLERNIETLMDRFGALQQQNAQLKQENTRITAANEQLRQKQTLIAERVEKLIKIIKDAQPAEELTHEGN